MLSILKGCVLIAFWLQLLKTMFVLESSMAGDLKLYGIIRHRVSKAINSHDGNKKKHDWFKNSLNYPLRQKKLLYSECALVVTQLSACVCLINVIKIVIKARRVDMLWKMAFSLSASTSMTLNFALLSHRAALYECVFRILVCMPMAVSEDVHSESNYTALYSCLVWSDETQKACNVPSRIS